ncbi:hypothetical protein BH11MYX2_BH11MYX2_23560 [soil metagenome]
MRKLAFLLLAVSACAWSDDRPLAWDRDRDVLGPIQLKNKVAYVDSALDRVTMIDLATDDTHISTAHIGRRAIHAMASADRHQLYVVTRGEEKIEKGMIDQPPLFWSISADDPEAEPIAYEIDSPFDRLAISPDNSTAIAYFSAAGPDAAGFFRNPNELAIIDLTRPPGDDNPTLKTIRSFGSVPEGVTLSPPMAVSGSAPRTFGFILSENNLTVLDVSHPERREISIRLDLGGPPVTPKEIVFAKSTASAYVRSDNARDVLQVLLQPTTPDGAGGNDFAPVLAELGAGGGPTDIAVYDDANGKRYVLAATPNTGEVVVIDADTAQFRSVPVADPIDRILLFPTSDDENPLPPDKALFASIAAKTKRVEVLDLTHITDPLTQASVRTITLDNPVRDMIAVPCREMAMLVHDDARTVLGLLDMNTESTSPLLGVGQLDTYDFSPDGSYLIGATPNVARVGFVALENLHPTSFRLDDPPKRVVSTTNGKIFVDHGDPLGRATIIPSTEATRDDAHVLSGFLTVDLLDQEP